MTRNGCSGWDRLGGAAPVALISAVLHLLVGWPESGGCGGGQRVRWRVPLAVITGRRPAAGADGGARTGARASTAGSAAAGRGVVYLVIVLGLGRRPATTPTGGSSGSPSSGGRPWRRSDTCRQGPAASLRYQVRVRHREAPGETLRTFGSRMTRAVSMDELLLQLAESLRKTMRLDRAEIYTGAGDVLERAVSVPDAGSKSIVLTDRERPVVARAGVSGSAWASIWLPPCSTAREQAQLRVAPISHAGELLGLIVVERPARADAFTEEDDRVLTELARQAGLAFHNSQLDSRVADHAGRAAQAGGRAARIAGPRRRQRGRRTPPGGTRPARRGAAASGGAGHQPPPGPRHRAGRPGRGRRDARPAGRRRAADHQGAA
jgi:hypothetical protein